MQATLITSTKPDKLTKTIHLDPGGRLVKHPGGQMIEGRADRLTLGSIVDLAALVEALTPDQALCYGITAHRQALILTQQALASHRPNGGPPAIARTREHFSFPAGPGLLMLDYDPAPGTEPLSLDQLRAALFRVCPALEAAPHLICASASAYIFKGADCLRGPGGWRVLVAVQNAADVSRAGQALFERAWLAGLGRIVISNAGSLLVRGPVDAGVWQSERLDFLAGAICKPPLEQRRPAPQVLNPGADLLDTAEAIKSLTLAERAELERLIRQAKAEQEPEARKTREAWILKRVDAGLASLPDADREPARGKLTEIYRQAINGGPLLADFQIRLASGGIVTVGELLDSPEKFHGKRCCDPLEPDWPDPRCGYIATRAAGRPYIFSHLHGGRRFALHRERKTFFLQPGERPRLVADVFELMKLTGSHYLRGGEFVTVDDIGGLTPRDQTSLQFDCDRLARFEKNDARSGNPRPADCPAAIATGLLAAKQESGLPELLAVASAPVIDPRTGRLIDQDGFDQASGLLMLLSDSSAWPGIAEKPTKPQVEQALAELWKPFEQFPFCGPVDRGVFLSALLSDLVRALLPTCPAYALDAPTAGSGKSLLALCLSIIAGARTPAVLPAASDQEELRKRLLALLRQGGPCAVLDNLQGPLDSPALCALLTAETYQDRLLGSTQILTVPTRSLFIITGNNVLLRGDLCRRVLTARLDPQTETPWKRRFDLDPADYCRERRLALVAAGLTVLRAGLQNAPDLADRTASFEAWSDSLRKTVCWLGTEGLFDCADPVLSIDLAFEQDPETTKLAALLAAWLGEFGTEPRRVADAISRAEQDYTGDLAEALAEITGDQRFNPRLLGRWIERNRGRLVGGLKFELFGSLNRAKTWRVVEQAR